MTISMFDTWAEDFNRKIYTLKEAIKEPMKVAIEAYSNRLHDKKAAIQNILNVAHTLDTADDGKNNLVDSLKNGASAQVKYLNPVALDEEQIIEGFKNAAHVLKYKNRPAGEILDQVIEDINLMSFITAQVEAKSSISR